MLSEEHLRRIQRDALLRAGKLSDDSLRKEAANLEVEHNDAAVGDEKTELGLMAHQYTLEMIRRGLTAK
jgi:hypothetical protein